MPIEITMPRLSDTMESGTVIKWNVKEGDKVSAGDVIADVETDKATMEMPVYDDGVISRLEVKEGQKVNVGTVIAMLTAEGEDAESAPAAKTETAKAAKSESSKAAAAESETAVADRPATPKPASKPTPPDDDETEDADQKQSGGNGRIFVSPMARRLAEEHRIDIKSIEGSGPGGRIMPVAELAIPGAHNVSNALAAIAAALLFGVAPEAIRSAAAAFEGVEHRLEPVALIDGVRFINDSQGTQPDAVAAALRAFEPPIVLIAGGRAKGLDLEALAPVVAERAVAAVLIGESGPDLEASFRAAGLARTERAGDLDLAVRRADAIAREALAASGPAGALATVLLSPAAASFDMFADYAARGRAFRAAVAALAAERARGGER